MVSGDKTAVICGRAGHSLAKRGTAASRQRESASTVAAQDAAVERVYVSLDESPTRRGVARTETPMSDAQEKTRESEGAARNGRATKSSGAAGQSAGPEMRDIFGPGGLLERSMIGGYE